MTPEQMDDRMRLLPASAAIGATARIAPTKPYGVGRLDGKPEQNQGNSA